MNLCEFEANLVYSVLGQAPKLKEKRKNKPKQKPNLSTKHTTNLQISKSLSLLTAPARRASITHSSRLREGLVFSCVPQYPGQSYLVFLDTFPNNTLTTEQSAVPPPKEYSTHSVELL